MLSARQLVFFGILLLSVPALCGTVRFDSAGFNTLINENQKHEDAIRNRVREQTGLAEDPDAKRSQADRTIAGSEEDVVVMSAKAPSFGTETDSKQDVPEINLEQVANEIQEIDGP